MTKDKKKIAVIGALPSSLVNFRGPLLEALIADGWDVVGMASGATKDEKIAVNQKGAQYRDYHVQRNGFNILQDIKTFFSLRQILKEERPDVIFCYTIKPVIWGGLASIFSGKPKFIALITGLGYVFEKGSFLKSILTKGVSILYKLSLHGASAVIFQNADNRQVMESRNITDPIKSHQVNGSGVNIDHYTFSTLDDKKTTFLLIARLLKAKGISEYVEAAKIVKAQYPEAIFQLLGPADPSPDAFNMNDVTAMHESGAIDYLGETDDVRPYIENCQIYVLPSYHEGLPRTVIEAMSIGRPIITTDVPGCRDTVFPENGFLVPAKDAKALASAMIKMIEQRHDWIDMGLQSRQFAENIFDVNKVNTSLLKIIKNLH